MTKPGPNGWLLILILPITVWSAWRPYDGLTWWLEVVPVFIGFAAIWIAQARGWVLSNFALLWVALHMILLLVGGHYTYARVPLGDWFRDWMGSDRNHYDRLGHVLQGLVPAVICREVMIRNHVIGRRGWLGFVVVCFSMAVSACYELVEWAAAEASEEAAESFLGTQGDHWDTQKDMACALVGALFAVIVLRVPHDRSLRRRMERKEDFSESSQ